MKIGIFWYWNNQVIGIAHSFNITKADSIGLIDSPYTHIEYWITLQEKYSELQNYEYEQIPRGRVIFDTNKEKSIIYLDKTLLYKSKINKVYDFFYLNPEQSVLKKDSHYQIWPKLLLDQQTCVKIHTITLRMVSDIRKCLKDYNIEQVSSREKVSGQVFPIQFSLCTRQKR